MAIEFGFVVIPLVFTILATVVTGLNYAEVSTLEWAARLAAREMQLGHVADVGDGTIRTKMCANLLGLVPSCTSSLQIYVKSGTSFSAIPRATITGTTMSPTTYSPGTNGSYVLLQVGYVTSFAPSIFGTSGLLGPVGLRVNMSPFLVMATVVFQNEPSAAPP